MRKTAELWKTITGDLIDTIECDYQQGNVTYRPDVRNVIFSPDSKTLAIGTNYVTLLYDIKTQTRKHTLDGYGTILKFSPDGKTLAHGGSHDGLVLLSDTETGTQKYRLTGHVGTVTGIAFSADGNTLATAGEDGTVLLWNLTSQ